MLPNFIIIGAMKGGTSSLYEYIATHPNIVSSSMKETNYFTQNGFKKGLDWYNQQFSDGGQYAFEASPNYSKCHIFPGVPERMFSILPKIKLIYIVRDPIERIISQYIHNYANGRESQTLSDILKDTNNSYIQTSKYFFQIQAFLEYYPENNLLIIESEQLRKDPSKTLNNIFNFLSITPEYDPNIIGELFHESKVKERKSIIEQELCKRINNPYLQKKIKQLANPLRKEIKKPILTYKEKEILSNVLAPDIKNLRTFSGLEFSDWSI